MTEYHKKYYQKNRQNLLLQSKHRYNARQKNKMKTVYQDNKETFLAYQKQYRKKNKGGKI